MRAVGPVMSCSVEGSAGKREYDLPPRSATDSSSVSSTTRNGGASSASNSRSKLSKKASDSTASSTLVNPIHDGVGGGGRFRNAAAAISAAVAAFHARTIAYSVTPTIAEKAKKNTALEKKNAPKLCVSAETRTKHASAPTAVHNVTASSSALLKACETVAQKTESQI